MSVRFSGNGKMVAATGGDKLVTLFDTVSEKFKGSSINDVTHFNTH